MDAKKACNKTNSKLKLMDGGQHQPIAQAKPSSSTFKASITTERSITTGNNNNSNNNNNNNNETNTLEQQQQPQISVDEFMDNLKQLFQECDTDNNGHLGRDKFKDLCLKIGLDEYESYETFDRLDIDKNGSITFEEFCAGFNQYNQTNSSNINSTADDYVVAYDDDDDDDNINLQLSSVPSRHQMATSSSETNTNIKTNGVGGQTLFRYEDSNSSNSLDHQSASNGVNLIPEDNRRSLRSTSKLTTRGPRNRSRSSSSRINNVSPIGTISLGRDNDDELAEDHRQRDSNVNNNKSDVDNDMIVLSNRDTAIGSSSVFNGRQVMTMQDLLDCVQTLQDENHKLAVSLMKEKKDRDEYLSRLGEEMDQQVKEVEARVGQRAKEEVETERKRLREMMKAEFDGLQTHFQTLEKVNEWIKNTASGKTVDGEKIEKVKTKLEDSLSENRQLRMSLLNTQTNVAMIRSEIDQLKEQYEEKCQELTSERERVYETLNECDHIKRQLNLMQDSNRKLQDASDAITTYISDPNIITSSNNNNNNHLVPHHSGATPPMMPRNSSRHNLQSVANANNISNLSNSRRGSILSDYIQDLSLASDCKSVSINSDLESLTSQMSAPNRLNNYHSNNNNNNNTINSVCDDTDDRSSQRSMPTYNNNINPRIANNHLQQQSTTLNSNGNNKLSHYYNTNSNNSQYLGPLASNNCDITANNYHSRDQQQVALKKSRSFQNIESNKHRHLNNNNVNIDHHHHHNHHQNPHHQLQQSSDNGEQTSLSMQSYSIGLNESIAGKSQGMASLDSLPSVESADGLSVTTYDIILVGDSYVGKSSFVARFMEGEFVVGIISNCGIDFKTKSYKIDGVNITINLWDTAGQERFRSITASYFRKADGIILMYDVTEKNSYLNVRNWMSTIMDTAAENVPVLLIGNKIDLRNQQNIKSCVPEEEGCRLAKEYDIVFLETSVKDGTNLTGSIKQLVRLMMARHQKPMESEDTIRLNDKSKTFRCMPQKC